MKFQVLCVLALLASSQAVIVVKVVDPEAASNVINDGLEIDAARPDFTITRPVAMHFEQLRLFLEETEDEIDATTNTKVEQNFQLDRDGTSLDFHSFELLVALVSPDADIPALLNALDVQELMNALRSANYLGAPEAVFNELLKRIRELIASNPLDRKAVQAAAAAGHLPADLLVAIASGMRGAEQLEFIFDLPAGSIGADLEDFIDKLPALMIKGRIQDPARLYPALDELVAAQLKPVVESEEYVGGLLIKRKKSQLKSAIKDILKLLVKAGVRFSADGATARLLSSTSTRAFSWKKKETQNPVRAMVDSVTSIGRSDAEELEGWTRTVQIGEVLLVRLFDGHPWDSARVVASLYRLGIGANFLSATLVAHFEESFVFNQRLKHLLGKEWETAIALAKSVQLPREKSYMGALDEIQRFE